MAEPPMPPWGAFAFPAPETSQALSRPYQPNPIPTSEGAKVSNGVSASSSPLPSHFSIAAGLDLSFDSLRRSDLNYKTLSNTGRRRSKDSAEKPYKCLVEGCDAAFHQVCNLRTHEVTKHGRKKKFERTTVKDMQLKPYQCLVEGCNSGFLHAGNLRSHEIQKHGRPKKFSRKARVEPTDSLVDPVFNLQSDQLQKSYFPLSSVAKPFQCTVPGCTSSYSQAGNLRTHEVYKHGRPKKFTRQGKQDNREESSSDHSPVVCSPLTSGALNSMTNAPFDSKARTAAWVETLTHSPPVLDDPQEQAETTESS